MLLYIIRHGEPDYSTDSLTANGKKQALALANRFGSHGFDEIYSSPLGRAKQTAEPTCERLKLPFIIEEWMSEDLVYNDFSITNENGSSDWAIVGNDVEIMKGALTQDNWFNHPVFGKCRSARGGYQRIIAASDEFLARLGWQREGEVYYNATWEKDTLQKASATKKVAAFCHHGLGTTWLSHLLSIPFHLMWCGFDIAHSGVTVLEFAANNDGYAVPRCLCWSDISHIYKEETPLHSPLKNF
ncbi:MAG: histidine phosphatase family protein [Lachnospiraceae bacterium]|nr:histidine phosphatase family protein [Lachnospiraceae bacterium]